MHVTGRYLCYLLERFGWYAERDDTYIIRWVDGAARDVSAILTQIVRYKEQFVSNKFQMLVTVLYEEQCGIVRINDRKKFELVQNSALRSSVIGVATEIRAPSCQCTSHKVRGEGPEERESSMAEAQGRITQMKKAFSE